MAEPQKRSDIFTVLVVVTFLFFIIGIGIAALEWKAYSEESPLPSLKRALPEGGETTPSKTEPDPVLDGDGGQPKDF